MKKNLAALLFFLQLVMQVNLKAQDISSLRDSLQFKILQDSFCSCVNRHANEDSKDWGDAIALSLFLKLDSHTPEYRNAEILIRRQFPGPLMYRLDHSLDSLIISDGFGKCVSLWPVMLKDKAGFFKMVNMMRLHPPMLQYQLVHMRELTGENLLHEIQRGVSDSLYIFFQRKTTFDSVRKSLESLSRETQGKIVTLEIKFERMGRDSSGIAKMKLLRDGIYDMGGMRIIYRKDDPYAKIESLGVLLRDSFGKEDSPPLPSPSPDPKKKK